MIVLFDSILVPRQRDRDRSHSPLRLHRIQSLLHWFPLIGDLQSVQSSDLMQIGNAPLDHFRRGHRLIDGSPSGFEHDGIKLHGIIRGGGFLLFFGVVLGRLLWHIFVVQFHCTLSLQ